MKMENDYRVRLSVEQAVAIFQRPKPKGRSWGEHYIYLVEVSHASGGLPNLVLESIVKYAAPDMRQMLLARADLESNDWLLQAERLANFAQAMTLDERPSRALGREVNAMDSPTVTSVDITCSYCKKKGHLLKNAERRSAMGRRRRRPFLKVQKGMTTRRRRRTGLSSFTIKLMNYPMLQLPLQSPKTKKTKPQRAQLNGYWTAAVPAILSAHPTYLQAILVKHKPLCTYQMDQR
jgi:hypothetical protein